MKTKHIYCVIKLLIKIGNFNDCEIFGLDNLEFQGKSLFCLECISTSGLVIKLDKKVFIHIELGIIKFN